MAQKSREEGEIGSESREKGDLPPCPPPRERVVISYATSCNRYLQVLRNTVGLN